MLALRKHHKLSLPLYVWTYVIKPAWRFIYFGMWSRGRPEVSLLPYFQNVCRCNRSILHSAAMFIWSWSMSDTQLFIQKTQTPAELTEWCAAGGGGGGGGLDVSFLEEKKFKADTHSNIWGYSRCEPSIIQFSCIRVALWITYIDTQQLHWRGRL